MIDGEKQHKGHVFRQTDQLIMTKGESGIGSAHYSVEDMNFHMRAFFGVVPAVLTHVIFCHQEESLWPFADQVILKKIFDEIFETSRYTKQLEELNAIIKQCIHDYKEFVTKETILRKDLEHLAIVE